MQKSVMFRCLAGLIAGACVLALAVSAQAVRIKDIAAFSGMRSNQLVGYGLVVGLSGTGDKRNSPFTTTSVINMMQRMGVAMDPARFKPTNVAAVMVTAKMSATAKPGSSLDVTVSSVGDATSLLGGILLQTPLKGVDGKVYALAQGPMIIGGYGVAGAAATAQKNVPTVGAIPGGATIERGVPFDFNSQDNLTLHMYSRDFSTTMQVVEQLNSALSGNYARASDAGSIVIDVPPDYRGNLVPLIASVENLEVTPENPAKVVVDEKTGTIVMGRDVRLSRVAVAHGGLNVVVEESAQVSQPGPFSMGQTVVVPETGVDVRQETRQLNIMEGATLQELVDGLNAIGATPMDTISILKNLKALGALYADLEVI
ncbi:MAG: flagellar basal body P-ring protein FlgI [Deltaproteobacteria bacterium]|jgi:flagellar P-ring protein precursor FlgI|nr:flagellar basal body P-ring protein FlgI [Deltaproteobacteria bacterium]